MNETDIQDLIRRDEWMMQVLRAARALALPDWMIGAGFVRNKVWDYLHGFLARSPYPDIDLIYFDPADPSVFEPYTSSTDTEDRLQALLPDLGVPWSVTNQARMHAAKNQQPFRSSTDALAHGVETATCIGVRLEDDDSLTVIAPCGIDDLVRLVVRLNPNYLVRNPKTAISDFNDRIDRKKWRERWPKLVFSTV